MQILAIRDHSNQELIFTEFKNVRINNEIIQQAFSHLSFYRNVHVTQFVVDSDWWSMVEFCEESYRSLYYLLAVRICIFICSSMPVRSQSGGFF